MFESSNAHIQGNSHHDLDPYPRTTIWRSFSTFRHNPTSINSLTMFWDRYFHCIHIEGHKWPCPDFRVSLPHNTFQSSPNIRSPVVNTKTHRTSDRYIFRFSLITGKVPSQWRDANVTPVFLRNMTNLWRQTKGRSHLPLSVANCKKKVVCAST